MKKYLCILMLYAGTALVLSGQQGVYEDFEDSNYKLDFFTAFTSNYNFDVINEAINIQSSNVTPNNDNFIIEGFGGIDLSLHPFLYMIVKSDVDFKLRVDLYNGSGQFTCGQFSQKIFADTLFQLVRISYAEANDCLTGNPLVLDSISRLSVYFNSLVGSSLDGLVTIDDIQIGYMAKGCGFASNNLIVENRVIEGDTLDFAAQKNIFSIGNTLKETSQSTWTAGERINIDASFVLEDNALALFQKSPINTAACDVNLYFDPVIDAEPFAYYTSNSNHIDFISTSTSVVTDLGTIIVNDVDSGEDSTNISPGDEIAIRMESGDFGEVVVANVKVGGESAIWVITTKSETCTTAFDSIAGEDFGFTEGNFLVNESGAATYRIPITISPGTAGMQPNLSLNYNSQRGNGMAGQGWSLGGLSVISRCAATLAQDSMIDGIDYDINDKFCLDGERLIVVQGEYGDSASVYHTEQHSFSKIVSLGNEGSGPSSFLVYTKLGTIMEYGTSENSQIKYGDNVDIIHWLLRKVSDRKGNYWQVEYELDSINNYYYPIEIQYTGNDAVGLLPYCNVNFTYENSSTLKNSYLYGDEVVVSKRLKEITSYSNSVQLRQYNLHYSLSGSSELSRLDSLVECGLDTTSCYNATVFDWNDELTNLYNQEDQYSIAAATGNYHYPAWEKYMGDVNGDGKSDALWIYGYNTGSNGLFVRVSLALPGGGYDNHIFSSPINTGNFHYDVFDPKVGDINGDGNADLLWLYGAPTGSNGVRVWTSISNGDGSFGPATANTPIATANYNPDYFSKNVGDVNGDGLIDALWMYHGGPNVGVRVHVSLSNGDGTYSPIIFNTPIATGTYSLNLWEKFVRDINGDGLADAIWTYAATTGDNGLRVNVSLSNGDGTFGSLIGNIPTATGNYDPYQKHMADVNGDGLSDALWVFGSPSGTGVRVKCSLSLGDGNFSEMISSAPRIVGNYGDYSQFFGDVNGDGIEDLILSLGTSSTGVRIAYALARGDGKFDPLVTKAPNGASTNYSFPAWTPTIGDADGDGRIDALFMYGFNQGYGARIAAYFSDQENLYKPNTINKITSGNTHETEITYAPLTDDMYYSKADSAVYPRMDYQGSYYAVGNIKTSNGVGGKTSRSYYYQGAELNLHGRGFRGFWATRITDDISGIWDYLVYERDWKCLATKLCRIEKHAPTDTLLSYKSFDRMILDYGNGTYHSVYPRIMSHKFELDGSFISSNEQFLSYDSFANPIKVITQYNDGHIDSLINSYNNDTTNWLIGQLTSSSISRKTPSLSYRTRYQTTSYDPICGLPLMRTIQPSHPTLELKTTYTYDGFGNIIRIDEAGDNGFGPEVRNSSVSYDVQGRFPLTSSNALGHKTTNTFDLLGNVLTSGDPNNLMSSYSYDDFGRPVEETMPDGTESRIDYRKCNGDCPDKAIYYTTKQASGQASITTYYDILNRSIQEKTYGFDGQIIYADMEYDSIGREFRKSDPYFIGDTVLWTTYEYDTINRVVKEILPGNRINTTGYNGLTTINTNPLNQINTTTVNALGQLVSSKDNLNNTMLYSYGQFGNLIQTTDPLSNVTILQYDILGNKIQMNDPDAGISNYNFNAFGELVSETDSRDYTTSFKYDVLGRISERSEPEGTTRWAYDNTKKGIGQISNVVGNDNTIMAYKYDELGRPSESLMIDENGNNYFSFTTYDCLSRLSRQMYPSGFTTWHSYNDRSYPTSIKSIGDTTTLWKAIQLNALDQLEKYKLGNGIITEMNYDSVNHFLKEIKTNKNGTPIQDLRYIHNDIGNILHRGDYMRGLSENFTYDGLNRLTSSMLSGTGNDGSISMTFDAIGNIISKSDVGTYTYGENGAGPHAVTSIVGTENNNYGYDEVGNRIDGLGEKINYTSFNKPKRIVKNGKTLNFSYDANYSRYKQEVWNGGTLEETKRYVGSYEEVTNHISGAIAKTHYLSGSSGTFARVDIDSSGNQKLQYLHSDHLGSTHTITDTSGSIVEVLSNDAWGLRRNGVDWGTLVTTPDQDRGFTGHEHLDEVGIIHMNGRVYDPVVGRFLSVDPKVVLGANVYTYSLNNPIFYFDLDGREAIPAFPELRFIFDRWISSERVFLFGGDGRDLQESQGSNSTSRIYASVDIDLNSRSFSNKYAVSSPSILYFPIEEVSRKTTIPQFDDPNITSIGRNSFEIDFPNLSGRNEFIVNSPPIQTSSNVNVAVANNILFLKGTVDGTTYPNSSISVSDKHNNKIILGSRFESKFGILGLYENKSLISFNIGIKFDQKGKFTGVLNGGKFRSIFEHNTNQINKFKRSEKSENQKNSYSRLAERAASGAQNTPVIQGIPSVSVPFGDSQLISWQ